MTITISNKGQLVLPAKIRKLDGVKAGERFGIERLKAGHYLLKHQPPANSKSIVDWLLDCPAKGWFTCIESKSTGNL